MATFDQTQALESHARHESVPSADDAFEPTNVWRRLPVEGGSSEAHMHQSDALSRLVVRPTIWWHWSEQRTLILGAGQPQAGVDHNACDLAGVQVIKRHTGGTSVYADPSLFGLDVALPPGHPLVLSDVVESYRWIGEVWVQALSLLGVAGRLVCIEAARAQPRPSREVQSILRLACFGSLSPYEVVVDGRKLVGLSQVRRAGRTLLQCGIYLSFEATTLSRLLLVAERSAAIRDLEEAAIGLNEAAGREVSRDEVVEAFSRTLSDRLGVVQADGAWTAAEIQYIEQGERLG